MKRRIEIITYEHERRVQTVPRPAANRIDTAHICPVCLAETCWLTTAQAARALQVKTATVQRWLATRKVHGIRTPGGQHRVCQQSLFAPPSPPSFPDANAPHQTTSNSTEEPCLSIPLVHSSPQS